MATNDLTLPTGPSLSHTDGVDDLYAQSREQQDIDDAAAEYEGLGADPTKQEAKDPAISDVDNKVGSDIRRTHEGRYEGFRDGMLVATGESEEVVRQGMGVTIIPEGEDVPATFLDTFSDVSVQTFGGLRDALQGIADLAEPAGDFLDSYASLGGIRFTQSGIEFIDPEEMARLAEGPASELPDVPPGRSMFAGMIRKVSQIAFGMKGVGGVLKKVGVKQAATKTGKVAEMTSKGVAAEVLVTEADEANLSKTLVEDLGGEYPFLKNVLTEALASDADDTMIEAKIKVALEGGLLGASVSGIAPMAKAIASLVKMARGGLRKAGAMRKSMKERTGFESKAEMEAAKEVDDAARLKGELDIFTPEHIKNQIDDLGKIIDEQGQAVGAANEALEGLEKETVPYFKQLNIIKAAQKKIDAATKARQKIIDNSADSLTVQIEVDNPEAYIRNRSLASASDDVIEGRAVDIDDAATATKPVKRTVPNLAKIKSTDDIDAAIAKMEEDNAPLIAKAKGGVVTQAETHAAGQELGWKELMALDPKAHGITAARLDALKDFYAASANMVRKTAEQVSQAPTDGNRFAFRKALMIHEAVLERFATARTEAGRALNILKRISDVKDVEALRGIKEINQELGGPEATDKLAELIATAKGLTNEGLNEVTRRGVMARTGAAVREAWTLGLVSGMRTQGRNLLSNFAFMLTRLPERAIAARLPGSEVEQGEALIGLAAMMWSTKASFVNAGKAFWHGTSGFGVGKVDLPRRKAIGGELFGLEDGNIKRGLDMMGEFYRVWGRFLVAGDELFKTFNYNAEIAMQSWRHTVKAGLKGKEARANMAKMLTDPTEEMRMTARLEAQRATFTQEPGEMAKLALAAKSSSNPLIAVPANALVPFVTTIANITKAGISYTPLAAAMPRTFWREIQKGGAARDLALAKMALGSMAMSTWSDFVLRGHVTGNGPSDTRARRRWINAGHKPYSVLIGDRWYDYRSIEPIGTMLGIMADMTEKSVEYARLNDGDDPEYSEKMEKLMYAMAAAVGNTINSQSFNRGLSEIIMVMSNPSMYAQRYFERLSTTVVPKVFRTGYELFDVETSQEWKDVRGIAEAIDAELNPMGAIPIRDALGHPVRRSDTFPLRSTDDDDGLIKKGLLAWASAISPIYTGKSDGKPFDKEIWKQGIRFGKPTKRQAFSREDFGGDLPVSVKVDMRQFPDVWDKFQALAGHELIHPVHEMGFEELMTKVIEGAHDDSDYYDGLPDGDNDGVDDKGKYIRGMAQDYRDAAKQAIWEDPAFEYFKEEIIRRARKTQEKNEGLEQ